MMRQLIAVFAVLLSAASSHAVTITFDDVGPAESEDPYIEAGVTFTSLGGNLGYVYDPGSAIRLDDAGLLAKSVLITTGSKFTPKSVTFEGNGFAVYGFMIGDAQIKNLFDGILVRGFRGNALVAEDRFWGGDVFTYEFDQTFSNIDALEIAADVDVSDFMEYIAERYPDEVPNHELGCHFPPCVSFDITSIDINTSPKKATCPRAKKSKTK
jgi:hypothetical protein